MNCQLPPFTHRGGRLLHPAPGEGAWAHRDPRFGWQSGNSAAASPSPSSRWFPFLTRLSCPDTQSGLKRAEGRQEARSVLQTRQKLLDFPPCSFLPSPCPHTTPQGPFLLAFLTEAPAGPIAPPAQQFRLAPDSLGWCVWPFGWNAQGTRSSASPRTQGRVVSTPCLSDPGALGRWRSEGAGGNLRPFVLGLSGVQGVPTVSLV